jgi:hypothetical protein
MYPSRKLVLMILVLVCGAIASSAIAQSTTFVYDADGHFLNTICDPRACVSCAVGTMANGCGGTLNCGCGIGQVCSGGVCQPKPVICRSGTYDKCGDGKCYTASQSCP